MEKEPKPEEVSWFILILMGMASAFSKSNTATHHNTKVIGLKQKKDEKLGGGLLE